MKMIENACREVFKKFYIKVEVEIEVEEFFVRLLMKEGGGGK